MRQPASFQTSPKTAQTVQKWLRYDLNSQRTPFYSYLSQFSTVLAVFWLVLTGKPTTHAGWVDMGAGAGQAELPMGYPRQSLWSSQSKKNEKENELTSSGYALVDSPQPFLKHRHPALDPPQHLRMLPGTLLQYLQAPDHLSQGELSVSCFNIEPICK